MSTNILHRGSRDSKGHARTDRTHLFVCFARWNCMDNWSLGQPFDGSIRTFAALFNIIGDRKAQKFWQFLCCTTMRMINLSLQQTNIKYATWRVWFKFSVWAQPGYQPNRQKSRQWQWRRV